MRRGIYEVQGCAEAEVSRPQMQDAAQTSLKHPEGEQHHSLSDCRRCPLYGAVRELSYQAETRIEHHI